MAYAHEKIQVAVGELGVGKEKKMTQYVLENETLVLTIHSLGAEMV